MSKFVVVHRVRFARFGAQDVEAGVWVAGRRLLVVNPGEVDECMAGDVSEVLTSPRARRYGRRAAAVTAARVVAVVVAQGLS